MLAVGHSVVANQICRCFMLVGISIVFTSEQAAMGSHWSFSCNAISNLRTGLRKCIFVLLIKLASMSDGSLKGIS